MNAPDNNSHNPTDCELERISALLDGELHATGAVDHADDAGAASVAEAYRRIDDAVLRSLACPPDQEAAIIAGSVKRVRELKRPKTLQYVLQAVAGIAAAAIIVFAWRSTQAPQVSEPVVAVLPDVADDTVTATTSTAAPRPMVGTTVAEPLLGTVRLGDMTLVSAGPVARPEISNRTPVATADDDVAGSVRHVWLVKDATAPLKWLRPLLPGHEDTLDHWINTNSDTYRLQLTLTDRELQGLVNQLASQGFALLSPDAPQPGLFRQGTFTERPVVYEVHFVEK
jgi:hypothetical protein